MSKNEEQYEIDFEKIQSKEHDIEFEWLTKLYLAIVSRDEDTLINLLRNQPKFSPSFWDRNGGDSPLHWSIYSGDLSILKTLVEFKLISINHLNHGSETPLLCSVKEHNYEMAELLLLNGADLLITNTEGLSPLHFSAKLLSVNISKLLVEYSSLVKPS